MWSSPISRSPDLLRLQDEGYEIEVQGGYLLVHNVPYVNARREVRRGTLASVLPDAGGRAGPPIDHTVLFAGEFPCHADGTEIEALRHGIPCEVLKPGLQARFSFSNKAERPDQDFYMKMSRNIRIISDPAKAIDDTATAATFRVVASDQLSPLRYADTASSRAGNRAMTQKLAGSRSPSSGSAEPVHTCWTTFAKPWSPRSTLSTAMRSCSATPSVRRALPRSTCCNLSPSRSTTSRRSTRGWTGTSSRTPSTSTPTSLTSSMGWTTPSLRRPQRRQAAHPRQAPRTGRVVHRRRDGVERDDDAGSLFGPSGREKEGLQIGSPHRQRESPRHSAPTPDSARRFAQTLRTKAPRRAQLAAIARAGGSVPRARRAYYTASSK